MAMRVQSKPARVHDWERDMRGTRNRMAWVGGLAMLLAITLPLLAWADDVARAKALFKQAEEKYAAEEYREALTLYEQAYEAKPLAGFHFNIAQCHRHLGEYEQAIQHFQRYQEEGGSPKHAEEAKRLIKLSEDKLEEHRAAAAALEEMNEEPPASSEREPPQPAEPTRSRRHLRPLYFWTGVGVTGALLVTGTITGAMALSKSEEFKDPATPRSELQDLKDSGEMLKTTSTATFVLGAATAAGTAALYFFTDFGSRESAVSAAPIAGGGIVMLSGGF
jgi:tetratricopeptide (TPR) repeat protein